MKIESMFSPGDKVWAIRNLVPCFLTVGLVRVEIVDSPGRPEEEIFDNYKPQKSHKEEYMCVETGIRTGSVFTLGLTLFKTKEEAKAAIEAYLKKKR